MGLLSNMRQGIPEHRIVNFPGTEEKVALVRLNTKEIINAREKAMKYITEHPVDVDTGDLILNAYILLESMKNPKNLKKPFADSIEEILENTDPKTVYELHNTFLEVQNGINDDIDEMTAEEFEELKKKLNQIQLKECDGELRIILKYCLQTLALKGLQEDK